MSDEGAGIARFQCPVLGEVVELTVERRRHIQARHPEIAPGLDEAIAKTLTEPEAVRASTRHPSAWMLIRTHRFGPRDGYLVVVVVKDDVPRTRCWIVTAYFTRRLMARRSGWLQS